MIEAAVICLALNIYHEARGEPLVGKIAVAQVVMNRVHSPQFPSDACSVVKQGEYINNHPVLNKCQFSWWCDGKSDTAKDTKEWEKATSLAELTYFGAFPDITEGALYYHATKVDPYWAKHYDRITQIENHIFYR